MRKFLETLGNVSIVLIVVAAILSCVIYTGAAFDKIRHRHTMDALGARHAHEMRMAEKAWERKGAELGAQQWIYTMIAERVVDSLKALLDGNQPLERLGR